MGACDLVLLQAPVFTTASTALSIHVRTKIRRQYSFIESAVVKLGNDILEVSSFGQYIYNGISNGHHHHDDNDDNDHLLTVGGFPVTYSQPSDKEHLFQIHINDDDDETISFKTFKDMVSVSITNANPERYRHSLGMMGGFDQHGAMVARDGTTILTDPIAMAAEWQVRGGDDNDNDSEPMLFQSIQGPQYPTQCTMPDTETQEYRRGRRRLGESHAREAAEKACAHWAEADSRDACVFDVLATGDLDAASAGAF